MRPISYTLAALLSVISVLATDETLLPDLEQAMMTIVTQVRQEQTLIFPHINAKESVGIDQERYNYVNSILSAVVPASELAEAQDSPSTFASIPLSERAWFEGLPTDVKEYLTNMAKAEQRMAELDNPLVTKVKGNHPRLRGTRWWCA